MSTSEITTIKLEPTQFKDLLITIDYVRDQLKIIASKLGGIESELANIKSQIAYLKQK
jgi:ribosomal protein S18